MLGHHSVRRRLWEEDMEKEKQPACHRQGGAGDGRTRAGVRPVRVALAEAAAHHCARVKEASAASNPTAGGEWESGASSGTWAKL
jgi:hypothetical protein